MLGFHTQKYLKKHIQKYLDSYSNKMTVKNSCEIIRKTEHCIKELFI